MAFQEKLYLCTVFIFYEHAETVKLRACSYQRKDCCHGSESSSAIRQHAVSSTRAARLRDGRSEASTVLKAFYDCTLKFKCGRSFEHSKLRPHLLLPKTSLGASLQLYFCFAAARLAASLRLCLKLEERRILKEIPIFRQVRGQ